MASSANTRNISVTENTINMARDYTIAVHVQIPAHSLTWLAIE